MHILRYLILLRHNIVEGKLALSAKSASLHDKGIRTVTQQLGREDSLFMNVCGHVGVAQVLRTGNERKIFQDRIKTDVLGFLVANKFVLQEPKLFHQQTLTFVFNFQILIVSLIIPVFVLKLLFLSKDQCRLCFPISAVRD